jgi:hypothetical protein
MTTIDWSALRPQADLGAVVSQGYQRGRAQGALGALARDPNNADALAGLASSAPEELYRFQAAHRTQADLNRGENFRGALATYLTGQGGAQPNALAQGAPAPMAPDALAPMGRAPAAPPRGMPGAEGPQSTREQNVPGTLGAVAAGAPDALAPPSDLPPEIVVQGRRAVPAPRSARGPGGDGWDAVVRADSQAAVKTSHDLYSDREDQLKDWQHVSQTGMRMLSGATDQDSYDRAKLAARHVFDAYGVGFPELPEDYSPENIRSVQMAQLDIEDQIKAALQERKFDWQRTDDELDNSRADRNTSSQIQDRDARRGLTARGQNMTDARGRYGIGVASGDRRRGQDLTDRRTREIAASPARTRAGGKSGGGAAAAAGGGGSLTRIAVGPDGKKVGWNGKAWVRAQ